MLQSYRKRRPPMEQLRDASKKAQEILIGKKVQLRESVIDHILKDPKSPTLPGLPPYLPHLWTLDASRNAIGIIAKQWLEKNRKNKKAQEDINRFFRFAIMKLEKEERKWRSRVRNTDLKAVENEKISEIFKPVENLTAAMAIKKFLVDSFAVSVIVKSNDSVSGYLEWFIERWTPDLGKLFPAFNKDYDAKNKK